MILGIMQPYFFPYIGYYQLINAVDTFVVYDDVNYIKQGWINRNYILVNSRKHLMTLELDGASSFKRINQIKVGKNRNKLIKTISQSYSRAPNFETVFPIIKESILYEDNNLARYLTNSLQNISAYLNLKTKIVASSKIGNNKDLCGEGQVLDICKVLKASTYINAEGGMKLYSKIKFLDNNIMLHFIKTKEITYKQCNDAFIPNLSIIDILMFNTKDEVRIMLDNYDLVQ